MKNQKVFVMGHKNPDTDSICSAIAYADIKNRTTQTKRYIPRRAGQINEETQYVLNRFGVQPPAYLGNIGTQVKDMDIRPKPDADLWEKYSMDLEMMEKDEGWLKNELHKRGYESYKDIFFAEWNELIDDERGKAGELYIVERTEKRD